MLCGASKMAILRSLAQIYEGLLADYEKAEAIRLCSLEQARANGNTEKETECLVGLGKLSFKAERYDRALTYFTQALASAQSQPRLFSIAAKYVEDRLLSADNRRQLG